MPIFLPRRAKACRVALTLAALAASAGAGAMPVAYQCIGYRPLTAEFTPREAQVHFEGKNWTLHRLRDAREATYVDTRAGVRVVTKGRELTLTHGNETLACKLQSEALKALEGDAAHASAPAPSAPASGR